MKPFFVYMLRCADGSYYVGHTDELERRIAQHRAGEIPGYTHERRPVELVWSQEAATREEALAAERQVKGWSRVKKEALIAGDWKAVQRHAWGTRNALPERLREGPSIPQGERNGPASVRPEVSKDGPAQSASPVHPEVSKGRPGSKTEPTRTPSPVRPEVSKCRTEVSKAWPDASNDHRALADLVVQRNRRALAKAITLLESTRPDHRAAADELLNTLLPHSGRSLRIGVSGVPGAGKSTFIEALGLHLLDTLADRGHRVAVLAVDPSSSLSGGSILGDKTRMERLAVHERAFIRPSPSAGNLGGVAEKTREAMLVCEAAGYDIVIVETVGVGQSETAVAGMTDLFVLLQLPNAGDDLQAIKRGITEIADLVVINKEDIDAAAATRARAQITSAMRLIGQQGNPAHARHDAAHWQPQVLTLSALKGTGVAEFWQAVQRYRDVALAGGALERRRHAQDEAWMWERIDAGLRQRFRDSAAVRAALPGFTEQVRAGTLAASVAARRLLDLFG